MEESKFKGETRTAVGTRASDRLRATGLLPVNIYGHKQDNRHVSISSREFDKFFRQGHRMLTIDVDGVEEHGVVREIQYDHLGAEILHVDLARVDLNEEIVMNVPIKPIGVAKGLSAGGALTVNLPAVQVEGPASKIPEKIEVNVSELDLNETIHVSDLEIPEGCRFQNGPGEVLLSIHITRKSGLAEGEAAEGEAAEGEAGEASSEEGGES